MSLIKKTMILMLLLVAVSASVSAQEEREALTACENLQVDQVCSFTSRRHGDVSGICIVPRNDQGALACKPERKPRN